MFRPTSRPSIVRPGSRAAAIEPLEGRRLRSVTLAGGIVTIVDGNGADTVLVDNHLSGKFKVTDNGVTTTFDPAGITKVRWFGNGGADKFTSFVLSKAVYTTEAHGGPGNDLIKGTAARDTLFGDAGNDTINGFNGDDLIDGGSAGVDAFTGDNDRLDGYNGNDTLRVADYGTADALGGAGNDLLQGGTRADSLDGGSGNDTLFGGDGDDKLSGGYDEDVVHGDAGNDSTFGGMEGNDTLDGGAGNDNLRDIFGTDDVTGGLGADKIDVRDTSGAGNIDRVHADRSDTVVRNDWDVLTYGRAFTPTAAPRGLADDTTVAQRLGL